MLDSFGQPLELLVLAECQGNTLVVVAACPTNPMQVDINIDIFIFIAPLRHSHIDHEDGVPDVDPPGHDVGAEEDIDFIVLELGENFFLLLDGHVDFLAVFEDLRGKDSLGDVLQVLRLVGCEVPSHAIE